MFRLNVLCALVSVLFFLSACSEEGQHPTSAEPQQQSSVNDSVESAKKKAGEAVEKAKASMEEAKQAVEKTVNDAVEQGAAALEGAKQEISEAGTSAKKKASETAAQVVEKTQTATAPAIEKTSEIVASSSEKINDLASKFQSQEKKITDLADSTAASTARKFSNIVPPKTISLENKFGTVTLTHKFHGETYGCATCHGDSTPGPFDLTKERAHSNMCKDCHKGSGGPVGCTECHVN